MRYPLVAALVAALCGPAAAQTAGVPMHSGDTTLRAGTTCSLNIIGEHPVDYRGLCNVARNGRTTVVDTGAQQYAIVRDPFNNNHAYAYRLSGGLYSFVDTAEAIGGCWAGEHFEFCAQ